MKKVSIIVFLLVLISSISFANGKKEVLVGDAYQGGLVWNNWTDELAGGSGQLPEGAENKDFIRCKACHGWDVSGTNGGYVRRSGFPEKDSRPRPVSSSDISGDLGDLTPSEILISDGREWSNENNNMPNFGLEGGLTAQQAADVAAYLNDGPKIIDFAVLDISANPVVYKFNNSDSKEGSELYQSNCALCHGADGNSLEVKVIDYFRKDGKYSEGFHKLIYGADSVMTRQTQGNLSGQQAADILSWIQIKADDPANTGL